jgi:hypothetical protein
MLVLSLGLATIIILEVFSGDGVKTAGSTAGKIPLDKTAPKVPALPLPKVKLPAKEERIRLATDRVLTNFGIRLDWIRYHGNDRDVRVPKEVHPLVIYQVLSNQVRHLGGKVESGTEDLRTGETTLTYSISGKMLGKIRLIPDPALTRHAGKIAIIIDDLGYTTGEVVTGLLKLKIPVTYSIIPGVKFSKEIAERLHNTGKSVMIHLPMQALERRVEMTASAFCLN